MCADEKLRNYKIFLRGYDCGVPLYHASALQSSKCGGGNKNRGAIGLSEEELEFIEEKGTVTIGCQTDISPLVFLDEETGEIQGITINILDMVAEATGLRFQYQELPSGSITYADLQQMGVDMVASVEYNDVNLQSLGIVMTDPYLQAEKVFVCKKGVLFDPHGEMVIAVASGSQTLATIIQTVYPHFQVAFYDTTEDALSALLSGEADAVLQNQYTIERILAKPKYANLQVVASASIGDSHCLASLVPISEDRQNEISDETRLLTSIINKGIASLDKNSVAFATIKGTVENAYQLTLWDTLYRYGYMLAAVLVILLLFVVLLRRNRMLRQKRLEQEQAELRARELSALNTRLHEQQLLLTDALERAEAGNRAKTAFLSNMSHDMRTPMNAILGFTTIASRAIDNQDKMTDCLNKIQESGNYLLQLINETLEMTEIDSGKGVLTEDFCNLTELITKAVDTLRTETQKKRLTVNAEFSQVKDSVVFCDSLRLNQILFNLLSNAVKYSKTDGKIEVSLRQIPSDTKEPDVYELRVKDTGIGMSPEFLAHIWEPFERERTTTESKTFGTGLGMTITKRLVGLMGGTIAVNSAEGEGTECILRFTFQQQ